MSGLMQEHKIIYNLREKLLAWTRNRTRVTSSTRCHPEDPLDQARILLLLDPLLPSRSTSAIYPWWRRTPMLALLLIRVFMLTTHIGKFWWKFSFQSNHLVGRILIIKRKNSLLDQGSNPVIQLNPRALQPLSHPDDPLGRAGISSLIGIPPYPPEALVPSIRDGGEHLCCHYF